MHILLYVLFSAYTGRIFGNDFLRGRAQALWKHIKPVQSAYRYAQDLDKSLNNIRIVTEKSTDQMAKFAVQANKAAKDLSATTTEYTDAALIFYQ